MNRLGGGVQARRNRRLPVGFERTFSQHLKLVLATKRNLITPSIDGGAVDAERPSKRSLGPKVVDSVCLSHNAIGLTCLTAGVKHSQLIDCDNGDAALLEAPPEIKQIFRQIIESTKNKTG